MGTDRGHQAPLLARVAAEPAEAVPFPRDEEVGPVRLPPAVIRSPLPLTGETRHTRVRQETTDDE